jgi:hypothetical protein
MQRIISQYFDSQLQKLAKTYPKVRHDFSQFQSSFSIWSSISLWSWLYKERWKNSSIPTGTRWWLRFVVFIIESAYIPIVVYSKRHIENIHIADLEIALEKVVAELSQ